MSTVKHGQPYRSYVKGDNTGWLQWNVSNDKHNIFKQKSSYNSPTNIVR